MLKKIFHLVLAALTVLGTIGPVPLLVGIVHAASPNELSYQGRLKDDDGVAVADGSYDFVFTLYTALSGGTADWTESQTLTVTDGYFSAQLGSVDGFLDAAGEEADFTVPLWLAVNVEGETLSPRVAINAVAYSFSSRSIESYASEAAAEADAENFGGRMYFNTTDGNLYAYDSVASDWVDTTAAAGSEDLDDAYNNFGAAAAVVNVDNAQGQGNLSFTMNGADLIMVDSAAETFVTFGDDGVTTIAKGLVANGTVALGDNGDTVTINSSDWDINATGDMTGIGAITADGAVAFTSTLAVTGNTTLTGDLAVNGDDISSDGDLTITVTGGQLLLADSNVFNIGGITGAAYNAISNLGGVADSVNVAADNDLYIQDDLEVDGTSVFDGGVELNGTTAVNAVTTFNASPVFNSTITADGAIEANGGITTQLGSALTLNSGDVDAINIGNDADAESINIGTGAATKTITIGNAISATVLNIDTGTGGMDIDLLGAMSIDGELVVVGGAADGNTATGDGDLYVVGDLEADGIADFDGSFDFDGTTFDADGSGLVSLSSTGSSLTLDALSGIEINASAGAISIGNDSDAQSINVGTAGVRTVNVGNAVGASALNLDTGTGGINLGDSANTKAIDIGGVTNDGADTISIATEGTSADVIAVGNSNAATTLALTGGDDWNMAATGVLTLSSSAAQTTALVITDTDYTNALSIGDNIILGTTAAIDFTNFDVGSTGQIYVAPGMGLDMNVVGGPLEIASAFATSINICNSENCDTVNIAINSDSDTVNIGNATGTTAVNINVGTGGINFGDNATAKAIDIGGVTDDGADTISIATEGTSADVIAVGNSNAATMLALTGGDDWNMTATGVLTLSASLAEATALVITDTDYTNALSIGDNDIIGTTAAINFTNFDVNSSGLITVATGQGIDANAAGSVSVGATNANDVILGNTSGATVINAYTGTGGFNIDLLGVMSMDGELVVVGGVADGNLADGDGDLYVVGDFEADGSSRYDGSVTFTSDMDAFFTGTENLVIQNTTGDAAVDVVSLQVTNTDTTAAAQRGLVITNASNAAVSTTESLLTLNNADGDAVTDGMIMFATGMITDAIDVSATSIVNAVNVGPNVILGTDAAIDFSEFDVASSTGSVTIDDDGNFGVLTVEGTQLDIDSLAFIGAASILSASGMAVTLTGGDNGTDAGDDVVIDSENWNVSATGLIDTNGGLTVSAGDIALTDNSGATWSITNAGVAQLGASVTIAGTADGTDALTLTTGDILVSNGDLDLSGGDFNVVLDANDSASITNSGAQSQLGALVVTNSYVNDADSEGFAVNQTLENYNDDGTSDTRIGADIVVANNAYDAGTDDIIYGLMVASLSGVTAGSATNGNNSDGQEYAVRIGNNWDADFKLGNTETISNQADDMITFSGNDGTNNAQFTLDLDGAVDAIPTITTSAANHLAINSSLSVGVDGTVAENITAAGFAISGGDDLYVEDDLGVDGDTFFDGVVSLGSEQVMTGATPDVSGGVHWNTNNGVPTAITNFTNGHPGQIIFIRVADNNTSLDCTASNLNCGTTDITLASDDFVTFFRDSPGNWQLVSLMDDSDNQNAGSGFDLAEWFPSSEALSAGDVASVDPNADETVRKSQGAYESTVIGIVSTAPGLTLGEPAVGYASQIALAGRVPVNVTEENGAIHSGDYLASSSTHGFAMKATEAGQVIGIAMSSSSGASGQVIVKIANFWYTPPTSSASSLQGSDGAALSAGVLSADAVVVSGNAVFEGSVTVEGHMYGSADMAGRARIVSGDSRVHIPFTNEYASQPIVTATLRTATDIPGYWWVEEENTTGFDLVLDGTLGYDVEFNWIALGVEAGRVSVSDGSSREINVYVVGGGAALELEIPAVVEAPAPSEEPAVEPVVEAPAPSEEPAVEPVVEPVVEAPAVVEPVEEAVL